MRKLLTLLALCLACLAPYAQELQPDSLLLPSAIQSRPYDVLFLDAMQQRQHDNDSLAMQLLRRCVQLDSTRSESFFFLAQYYFDRHQPDSAFLCYQRAANLEPDNDTYTETLAQVCLSMERYDEAAQRIERLLKSHPGQMDKLRLLYNLYRHRDSLDAALSALQRMEDVDGKNERLSYEKSELLTRMGRHSEAIAEMRSLADAHPADLNYRSFYADILMMNDSTDKAIELYHDILERDPKHANALASLRSWHAMQGDVETVDSLTRRLLLHSTLNDEQRLRLMQQVSGNVLKMHADSSKVLALFHELLAQPKADPTLALLGAAFMKELKMPDDSLAQMYLTALSIAPDYDQARFELVRLAWANEQLDTVITQCQLGRKYNPEEMAFYYYQAIAYNIKQKTDLALDALKNGISVITKDTNRDLASDFYAIMGDLLHEQGHRREAYAAYDSCLAYKPDNAGCLNNYAYFLALDNQQLDRAEQMAQAAIKSDPKSFNALDTYAWILYQQQRYAEARIYIEEAIMVDTTKSWVILDHAGDIYLKLENREKALDMWQKAKDNHTIGQDKDKWWEEDKALRKKLKKYKK
jgi:tetratricopeptide (TPR) repeat protein